MIITKAIISPLLNMLGKLATLLPALLAANLALAQTDSQNPALPATQFTATIKNSSANGVAQCLIFGANGTAQYPQRYNWSDGPYCGFAGGIRDLVANRQAIWQFTHIKDNQYIITNASSGQAQCLIFGANGTAQNPSRYNWSDGPNCGFPDQASLLANGQAVYRLTNLEGNKYMITNNSAGKDQCLLFGANGQATYPARYNWADGAYCGFPGKQALLDNKQAVWEIDAVNGLPANRFNATIRNASANGTPQCLIFGANGNATFPERYNWADGPNCGFPAAADLLANRQGVWQFVQIKDNQYIITNSASGQEQCLIFGANGNAVYPQRYNWAEGPWCGFPDQAALLANRQAVFTVHNLTGNQYMITNGSSGKEQCLLFGANGQASYPSRYNWNEGAYCGFPSKQALLDNKQAVWEIMPVAPMGSQPAERELVARFAPELRFDRAAVGYPMSAQTFYQAWKNYAGGDFLVENTSKASLASGSIPTYYQFRQFGNQVRITYWWFYGYQHPCAGSSGSHQGDWEHVMVTLNEAQTAIAAVTYFQHGDFYTRIGGPLDASCGGIIGTGRCSGSHGFESTGTHPVVYTAKTAHGSFHDSNSIGLGTYDACTYYGDYRNPASAEDYMASWKKLVNLDDNDEAWIGDDRTAKWAWGPDGISNHPTQHAPTGNENACSGSATNSLGWPQGAGCYMSECLSGDEEDSGLCYKECKPGYTNIGLVCHKNGTVFDFYSRLDAANGYQYDYKLPQSDAGIMRRRGSETEWNMP